jgi:xanthine dehydrogenase accessory factor
VQFFDRLAELERKHATFAVATVVGRNSPVSSHLGDRALIFPDGRMEGFVGGSCSRDIVRRHGLLAIETGKPRLLHIRPELPGAAEQGTATEGERIFVPMGCSSEGAVDVYVEPHIPLRSLVVVGFTPVADALAQIAAALDYEVVRVIEQSERRDAVAVTGARIVELDALPEYLRTLAPFEAARLVAVVASQGHYDEAALATLCAFDIAFLGLLASRKRAAAVRGTLLQEGVSAERLSAIRNPVGLDIGARSPGEVAISVLAEIITATPARTAPAASQPPASQPAQAAVALDPVCGMDVDVATARHRYEVEGREFVFCCAGCRTTFAAQPERYLSAARPS